MFNKMSTGVISEWKISDDYLFLCTCMYYFNTYNMKTLFKKWTFHFYRNKKTLKILKKETLISSVGLFSFAVSLSSPSPWYQVDHFHYLSKFALQSLQSFRHPASAWKALSLAFCLADPYTLTRVEVSYQYLQEAFSSQSPL